MLFAQVTGNTVIKQKMQENIRNGRVSHAQMFLGKNGYGTLSLALAYIQYLYCEDRTEIDSCGKCLQCRQIIKLEHPDIHFSFPFVKEDKKVLSVDYLPEWKEIIQENPYFEYEDWLHKMKGDKEGKSNKQGNITAEEVRSIIYRLSLTSHSGGFKTVLIFLPEYLDKEGNILLKIFEEPPEKTLFILVAENENEILPTILSRMQITRVPQLSDEEIEQYLIKNYSIEQSRANYVSKLAEGNLNRAISIYHETDNPFTPIFISWMRFIYRGDYYGILKSAEEISALGRENIKHFILYAIRMLRQAWLIHNHSEPLVRLLDEEKEFAKNFAPFVGNHNVEPIIALLDESYYFITRNANDKMLFFNLSLKTHSLLKRVKEIY